MITLYAFQPAFGLPSASPFVVKTMIHLALAGQPYDIEIVSDLKTTPKGKLPYIRDKDLIIADSEFIRAHLENRHGADFDPGLTAAEKAEGIAWSRLIEDHLYWCGLYEHWQVDVHWARIKPMIFSDLPPNQMDAIAETVRDQLLRDLHGQGLGRHRHDEVLMLARKNLEALATRVGNRRFWFGDTLTSTDAVIAPHIQAMVGDPLSGPLNEALYPHRNLIAYARRVLNTALPDHMVRLAA